LRLATSSGVKREEFISQYLDFILKKTGYKIFYLQKIKIGKNLLTEIILK
jgi:hypothetical protein